MQKQHGDVHGAVRVSQGGLVASLHVPSCAAAESSMSHMWVIGVCERGEGGCAHSRTHMCNPLRVTVQGEIIDLVIEHCSRVWTPSPPLCQPPILHCCPPSPF